MTGEDIQPEQWRERLPASTERVAHAHKTARELRKRATSSEQALWTALRGRRFRHYRFRRQHPIGPYIVDFDSSRACLVIDVDGPIHASQTEYDAERQAELEGAGYRMPRVTVARVMHDLPATLRLIETTIRLT
jgi:very-short-patch-repair endonuclease